MTLQLPAHLQGRAQTNIAEKSTAGLGASLPPHVSIRGNTFTLVDAGGQEFNAGATLDACIIDCSDQLAKQYYKNKWTPDANEPPTCWSANGIAPSRDAAEPQARTCAECEWNKRGSAVSGISGVAIKACRDEVWLALLLPQWPKMLFQLKVTPGSFTNWVAYTKNFNKDVDVSAVVTRLSFQPQVNGVMCFEILGYAQNQPQFVTVDLLAAIDAQLAAKATDILVGRNDQPRQTALPAPEQAAPAQIAAPVSQAAPAQPPAGFGAPQGQPPQTVPFGQPAGMPVQQQGAPQQPARRKRRTNAEIAQANGQPQAAPASAPFAQPVQQTAPFAQPQQPSPATPAAAPAGFGMAPGASPTADIANMLEGVFGKVTGQA